MADESRTELGDHLQCGNLTQAKRRLRRQCSPGGMAAEAARQPRQRGSPGGEAAQAARQPRRRGLPR